MNKIISHIKLIINIIKNKYIHKFRQNIRLYSGNIWKIRRNNMNNFKLMLKVNNSRNIDEIICNKITLEMKKLCRDIKEREEKEEENKSKKLEREKKEIQKRKIEQIENRIRGISKIFINFQRNMENIRENEIRNKLLKGETTHEVNETDKELQKVIEKAEKEMYEKIYIEEDKNQIADRMNGIKELLENFDDDMNFILRLEMQQTKMGNLIIEEEKMSQI